MSNQETHPNLDPLGLKGKMIGLHPSESKKYMIDGFSYPASFDVWDEELQEKRMQIGYICMYQVKFNFKDAGRKVVTYKIRSVEIGETEHQKSANKRMIINFLESNAEEVLANNMYDTLLKWEEHNQNDTPESKV